MKKVTLTEFSREPARFFDLVRVGKETVSVSRHGVEIAKVVPVSFAGLSPEKLIKAFEESPMDMESVNEFEASIRKYRKAQVCRF